MRYKHRNLFSMLKFVFNVLHTKFGSFGNLGIGLPASASALASTMPAALRNDCVCITNFFKKKTKLMTNTPQYSFLCLVIRYHNPFATIRITHFSTTSYPTSMKVPSKASMLESILSTLADIPGSFSCYLVQLFCRELGSACFRRKGLLGKCYFETFKNTQAIVCRSLIY